MPTNKKTNTAKARVGGSSLGKKSTLFTKRNGIIVAALAAIAGLAFVAFSFAGGSTYKDFQYSVNVACGVSKKQPATTTDFVTGETIPNPAATTNEQSTRGAAGNKRCISYSSEAFVYRLYKAVLGRNPDASGYAYWTQKLAGDQVGYEKVVATFLSVGQPKAKLASPELKENSAFVAYLTENFTGEILPVSQGKEKVFVDRLNSGKLTRAQVVARYAAMAKTIAYHEAGLQEFLKTAPKLNIVTYAKPGLYAKPTTTPTCAASDYKLFTDALFTARGRVNTSKYSGGEVSRYTCLPKTVKKLSVKPGGYRFYTVAKADLAKTLPTIKCPEGYKVVKEGGGDTIDQYTGAVAKSNYWAYCIKK